MQPYQNCQHHLKYASMARSKMYRIKVHFVCGHISFANSCSVFDCNSVKSIGSRRIFSEVSKLWVWDESRRKVSKLWVWDESLPAGSRDGGLGLSPQKPTTGCENNAPIVRLLSILLELLMHKNTLQHFQRGKCPLLPMPAGVHGEISIDFNNFLTAAIENKCPK